MPSYSLRKRTAIARATRRGKKRNNLLVGRKKKGFRTNKRGGKTNRKKGGGFFTTNIEAKLKEPAERAKNAIATKMGQQTAAQPAQPAPAKPGLLGALGTLYKEYNAYKANSTTNIPSASPASSMPIVDNSDIKSDKAKLNQIYAELKAASDKGNSMRTNGNFKLFFRPSISCGAFIRHGLMVSSTGPARSITEWVTFLTNIGLSESDAKKTVEPVNMENRGFLDKNDKNDNTDKTVKSKFCIYIAFNVVKFNFNKRLSRISSFLSQILSAILGSECVPSNCKLLPTDNVKTVENVTKLFKMPNEDTVKQVWYTYLTPDQKTELQNLLNEMNSVNGLSGVNNSGDLFKRLSPIFSAAASKWPLTANHEGVCNQYADDEGDKESRNVKVTKWQYNTDWDPNFYPVTPMEYGAAEKYLKEATAAAAAFAADRVRVEKAEKQADVLLEQGLVSIKPEEPSRITIYGILSKEDDFSIEEYLKTNVDLEGAGTGGYAVLLPYYSTTKLWDALRTELDK